MTCIEQRDMTTRALGSLETGHFPCLGFCPPRGTLLSYLGFPGGSAGKESACNAGDLASIPWLARSPGGGKGYPLQYSSLENSMKCTVHGVAKSQTPLSDFHFLYQLNYQGIPISPISAQFSSVAQLCPTLCDPMGCSTPGLPVHHQPPEFTQTHVH